jgi:hypothetical protein
MKRILFISCVAFGACSSETFQHEVSIVSAPPLIGAEPPSALQVPQRCPIYAPGGGDVDVREAPFPDGFSIICAVDDTGATYGVVNGDAPTAHLAVLPGDREIGIYFGFEPGSNLEDRYTVLTGDDAGLDAYAAPSNVHTSDCCAELHPDARLSLRAVASGPTGLLVSLGYFDRSVTQVAGGLSLGPNTGWVYRFYVNGEPSSAP